MKISSNSFKDGGIIPSKFAFAAIDPETKVKFSDNRNPHLTWSELPPDTQSLVLICHDRDVPSKGDNVNQEGEIVPADLPRVDFFHWVLIDIPPVLDQATNSATFDEGIFSHAVTPRGKDANTLYGARHGINDYTGWFAGDKDMSGDYYGYDGPCPPWNDSIPHHYVFTLYALDIKKLPVADGFTGSDVRAAIQGHVLDQASMMGIYTLTPSLAATIGN